MGIKTLNKKYTIHKVVHNYSVGNLDFVPVSYFFQPLLEAIDKLEILERNSD